MSSFAMRVILAMAVVTTGCALAQSTHAVQRDPGGQGQVLIYPYYTVTQYPTGQRSKQTLVSIINTSDAAQVVQVTFREALNGRDALQFKLWLGKWDVWTGTVFALVDDGLASDGVAVLTRDRSCTTPLFSTSGLTTSGGTPYLPFGVANYSGPMSDGGPSDLLRARHGWIEVISLANVTGPSAAAINAVASGAPANCAAVQNLSHGPDVSTRPSGGLAGTVSIISVAEGTVLSSSAEALSGFTGLSLYRDAMQPSPDLSSVNEGMPGGPVSAMVVDELGRNQVLTYGATGSGSRPIDAVSATMMATRVKNEHQSDAAVGGLTDWVLTMPTKPFYTDPALIGPAGVPLPPFDEAFMAPGRSRQCVPYSLVSQEQRQYNPVTDICSLDPSPPSPPPFGEPRGPLVVGLFQAVNVIPFLNVSVSPTFTGVLAAPQPPGATNPNFRWFIRPSISAAGWLDFNLAATNFNHRLPASSEGKVLSGLPAIGYSASSIVNGNIGDGVLANYASTVRHVTTVACSKASDGSPCD